MIDPLVIVLALLAIAIVMFVINKPRMDAVALIMLAALPFTGVLTMQEALAGFSDSNVVLIRHGEKGFRFFAFTPFGVPILILGILYMVIARRWLPVGDGPARDSNRPSLIDWVAKYKLANRQYRLRATEGSLLIGQSL